MTTPTLTIYIANWCPHCRAALAYLKENRIPHIPMDMDSASPAIVKKIDEVNNGSWVVPTLECRGKWIPGKPFTPELFEADLKKLGVMK